MHPRQPPAHTLGPDRGAGVPLRKGLPLPRKVTLAIRSPLLRSSETVLRWTSRAMLVQSAWTLPGRAAGKELSGAAHAAPSSPCCCCLLPMLPTETKAAELNCSFQRLTKPHSPVSPAPLSSQPSARVTLCVRVCCTQPSAWEYTWNQNLLFSSADSQIKLCPASGVFLQLLEWRLLPILQQD